MITESVESGRQPQAGGHAGEEKTKHNGVLERRGLVTRIQGMSENVSRSSKQDKAKQMCVDIDRLIVDIHQTM
jgi:hypothetical protein